MPSSPTTKRPSAPRARLDFDDLVTRTAALFGDQAQGAWVRYKLDAGVTHILVDESQDTNPEQWKVVDALAEEFFAGESAAQRPRSLFAVGDPKQSIFSFQGAEPRLFARSGDSYQQKAKLAGRPFARLPMAASFRTLQNVLDAVDKVFLPGPAPRVGGGRRNLREPPQRPHPFRWTGDAVACRRGRAGARGGRPLAGVKRRIEEPGATACGPDWRYHCRLDRQGASAGRARSRHPGRRCADPGAVAQCAVSRDHPGL